MKEKLIKLISEMLSDADLHSVRVIYAFVTALLKK